MTKPAEPLYSPPPPKSSLGKFLVILSQSGFGNCTTKAMTGHTKAGLKRPRDVFKDEVTRYFAQMFFCEFVCEGTNALGT